MDSCYQATIPLDTITTCNTEIPQQKYHLARASRRLRGGGGGNRPPSKLLTDRGRLIKRAINSSDTLYY